MTPFGWRLFGALARALEPAERAAVLGDIAESGEGIGAAMRDLLGLIVRRQAGLWTSWRPWLALFGVGCLAGAPLSQFAFGLNSGVGQQLMAYHKYGVHFETGLTAWQDVAFLLCLAGVLSSWSWTCGFALGSLSGRAVWLTWCVFLMAATIPFSIAALLSLSAASWGMRVGLRRRILTVRHAYRMGAAITILTVLTTWMSGWYETAHEVWSGGVWPGVSWPTRVLPFLLAGWPAAYVLATACLQHTEEGETT